MEKGKSGVINLECPILLTKDSDKFIHSLPKHCLSHPSPDIDLLKTLCVPSVNSALIKCFYYIQIHFYYNSLITNGKLKTLVLPILVCRPI